MSENIFKPPKSDLGVDKKQLHNAQRSARYTQLAFAAAPPITSILLLAMALLASKPEAIGFAVELSNQDILGALTIAFYVSIVAYACTLVFGLPLHYVLGKLNRRKLGFYALTGFFIPSLFILALNPDLAMKDLFWLVFPATGALCASLFWFFAVYLLDKKNSAE